MRSDVIVKSKKLDRFCAAGQKKIFKKAKKFLDKKIKNKKYIGKNQILKTEQIKTVKFTKICVKKCIPPKFHKKVNFMNNLCQIK
jgi:hypothetical protein